MSRLAKASTVARFHPCHHLYDQGAFLSPPPAGATVQAAGDLRDGHALLRRTVHTRAGPPHPAPRRPHNGGGHGAQRGGSLFPVVLLPRQSRQSRGVVRLQRRRDVHVETYKRWHGERTRAGVRGGMKGVNMETLGVATMCTEGWRCTEGVECHEEVGLS